MKNTVTIFDKNNNWIPVSNMIDTIEALIKQGFRPNKEDKLFDVFDEDMECDIYTIDYILLDYQIIDNVPTLEWEIYLKEEYRKEI